MNLSTLFCCCLLAVLLICRETAGNQVYCGTALTLVLNAVCENGFHSLIPSSIKRSGPYANTDDYADISPLAYSSLFLDPLFGEYANTVAKTRRRRYTGGVYDDCCRKGCSYAELQLYCK